ncbi:Nucleosomal histone H3-Lys79 methylase [Ascosphaera aggregata]|nr:Nucleosomal histone H3-Lys79 methylase [Ascosphaera aggregata]
MANFAPYHQHHTSPSLTGIRKTPLLRSTQSKSSRPELAPSPRTNGLKKLTHTSGKRAASAAVGGRSSNLTGHDSIGHSNGISRTTSAPSINGHHTNGNGNAITTTTTTTTTTSSSSSSSSAAAVSRTRKRQSYYNQPLSSDSSDNDDSSDVDMALEMRKRTKMSVSAEPDFKRRIKMVAAFDEGDDGDGDGSTMRNLKFVHAADITSVHEFDAAFAGADGCDDDNGGGDSGAAVAATTTTATTTTTTTGAGDNSSKQPVKWTRVEMQYPSICPREQFTLVVPHDDDGFKPIDDIVRTIEAVSENYIPTEHLQVFDDPTTGLKRRLRRALAHSSESEFCDALRDYNKVITKLRKEGVISKQLDVTHGLPLSLVERILTQIYARTVSPRVETLKRYENGSDNVYGELLPRFITDIFKQTKLKSGQVFVDLGSGVGNVVLQAALEIGCESWGCEMMSNACDLAELQQKEFEARCALWGISPGSVHLVRGDFLKQESIIDVLRRADVVLINNQAFTPQLNDKITNLFLDMKEGVQIVSLKGFVPAGHKITARNFNSPINLLSVKKFEYWSEYVSWTDAGGDYFIATKDSQHLRRYAERM